MVLTLLFMGLVAELLVFFVLWSEGLLIAFAGATVAGMLAMVATGVVLSLRREEPTSRLKDPTSVDKIGD